MRIARVRNVKHRTASGSRQKRPCTGRGPILGAKLNYKFSISIPRASRIGAECVPDDGGGNSAVPTGCRQSGGEILTSLLARLQKTEKKGHKPRAPYLTRGQEPGACGPSFLFSVFNSICRSFLARFEREILKSLESVRYRFETGRISLVRAWLVASGFKL